MPPLPKTPGTSSPGTGRPTTGARGRSERSGSSSAPSPRASGRSRTSAASVEALEEKLARMYMMMGTAIRPFGRFNPVLIPIGDNLKTFSDEAASAWIDLAKEDSRVMDILQSLTGASVWGNVIGLHLAIFASAIPGGQMMAESMIPPNMQDDPIAAARAMGMSEAEIQEAMNLAARMAGTPQEMPARDKSTGGPGDTVQAGPPPSYQETATPASSAAPPPVQSTAPQSKAAIVTAEELGVVQPGVASPFPQSGPPNGRAGQE